MHMRMPSQNSTPARLASGRMPQRHRGRMRVAALMQAAATVFAEKGFDAATMTEIAALAGAPIGSLYQFFANKEALADALLEQYGQLIESGLAEIEHRAAELSAMALADALVDLIAGLRQETGVAFALLDARSDWSARRAELRRMTSRLIARILTRRAPQLASEVVENMAVVLLHNIRAMAALIADGDQGQPGALAELRDMTGLYVASRLSRGSDPELPSAGGCSEVSEC